LYDKAYWDNLVGLSCRLSCRRSICPAPCFGRLRISFVKLANLRLGPVGLAVSVVNASAKLALTLLPIPALATLARAKYS